MQKKLIALAIAGLASTTAFAQSNVTIYGVFDASVDFTNVGDTPAASGERATKISSNVSKIGLKGSEIIDEESGLKAVFQIETAFNTDGTATTNLNGRNTYVGLASDNWGRVILGKYDTPYRSATRSWDMFNDHLGDNRNLLGGVAGKSAAVAFDARPTDTVRYDSPKWGDFSLAAAYVAGAETVTTGSSSKGAAWSLSGTYEFTSEWTGVAAYEKHDIGACGTGTIAPPTPALPAVCGPATTLGVPTAVVDTSEKAWKLGASYKSGPIRGSFIYEKTSDDFAISRGHKAWSLAGGYMLNASNEVKLAYTKVNDLDGIASSGAKQWVIGLDHILSKRTKMYAEYTKLKNDTAASYGLLGAGGNNTAGVVAGGGVVGIADADPSAFQFGVKHSF